MRQNSKIYFVATIFENKCEKFGAKIDKIAVFYRTFWRRKVTVLAGNIFLRTDQLDGETDWKAREAVHYTQNLRREDLLQLDAAVPRRGAPKPRGPCFRFS